METAIALAQIPRVDLRDAEKRYNPFTLSEIKKVTTNLNWDRFFGSLNLDQDVTELNVNTPSYFDGLNELLAETNVAIWKKYLKYHLVDSFASIMGEDLSRAHFELHSKAVAGIEEQLPRWKRAVNAISGGGAGDFGALGDVVGRLYVARHFPPDAKAEMDKLVQNLSLIHI